MDSEMKELCSGAEEETCEEKMEYAQAAGRLQKRSVDVSLLEVGKVEIERREWEVFLTPPKEVTESRKEKTIVYRTMRKCDNRVAEASQKEAEAVLGNLNQYIEHKKRGKCFGYIQCRFVSSEAAKKFGLKKLESDGWVFLPTYMNKRVSKITLNGIPFGIKEDWMVESALKCAQGEIDILSVLVMEETEWKDKSIEVTVLATIETLESLLEVVNVDESRVVLRVEGKRPRCFSCKRLGHVMGFCPSRRNEEKKGEEEKKEENKPNEEETTNNEEIETEMENLKEKNTEVEEKRDNSEENVEGEGGDLWDKIKRRKKGKKVSDRGKNIKKKNERSTEGKTVSNSGEKAMDVGSSNKNVREEEEEVSVVFMAYNIKETEECVKDELEERKEKVELINTKYESDWAVVMLNMSTLSEMKYKWRWKNVFQAVASVKKSARVVNLHRANWWKV